MVSHSKNLGKPDESLRFPGITEDWVEVAGFTVSRSVQEPGWRWSTDMRPLVGGDWCEAHHVGVVLSGRWGALLRDGRTLEWGPDDVFDCPPGHDGYTIGDEPAVMIEWSGLRTFVPTLTGFHDRVLSTLLFTDLVDSTQALQRLGDSAWQEVLSNHYLMARSELERFGGREIDTTGDGLLATFEGPAKALRCAAAIRAAALREDLHIRAGVHVGEVAVVGTGLRGAAVHEAARIMARAAPDEILVSETTRLLSHTSGLGFEDRGEHELKGFPGARRLFAYIEGATPTE